MRRARNHFPARLNKRDENVAHRHPLPLVIGNFCRHNGWLVRANCVGNGNLRLLG